MALSVPQSDPASVGARATHLIGQPISCYFQGWDGREKKELDSYQPFSYKTSMVVAVTSRTSRGAHIHARALYECLTVLIEQLPEIPSPQRVRLRTMRATLARVYQLEPTESDIAHLVRDEDGETDEVLP